MDLSALIFVALAVAWAVYLIPKALRHHEEDAVGRPVDNFSDRMRVLARRDAVTADKAELVVGDPRPKVRSTVVTSEVETEVVIDVDVDVDGEQATTAALSPSQQRLRRAAAARAARRRRRVLGLILLATVAVVALAAAAVVEWPYVAVPAGVLVAWLVACRLMVRREQAHAAASVRVRKRRRTLAEEVLAEEDESASGVEQPDDDTAEATEVVAEADEPEAAPGGWDPVPVTLPTYVAKASAGRTVRTIDLDSTGVWSSGRNEADSQLAREARAEAHEATTENDRKRASGA